MPMLLVRQALAEYAALAANRALNAGRLAFRQVSDIVSENFLAVAAVLVLVVLFFTLRVGRGR